MRSRWSFVLVALPLFACGPRSHPLEGDPDAGPPVELPAAGSSAALVVGDDGGTLTLGTLTLEVPAGAVAAGTELRVTVESAPPDAPFTGFSPVFRFEPEGLVFDHPVTVRVPFNGDADTATVFWTTLGTDAYAPLPTRIEGRYAIAETTHFSSAFAGTACGGEGCCGRARGDLDVLLVVDNSNSMSEEQASLREQIPRLARVLATGDLEGDGVQDFPALRSVRMGSVSTDMGGGGFTVPSCENGDFGSEYGDDGVLRTEGRADIPGCAASYPSFAELNTHAGTNVDAFVEHVSCVATMGIGGCGFEQQLEAALKALTPSTSPIRFVDDTTGHGDGANAGFLRDDALLATILLTDEEDCSVSDPNIFDPASTTYTGDLNVRCFSHPGALHPVTRFSDGLTALKPSSDDVIFAAITGVPTDLVSDPDAIDYAAILSDPRMIGRIDPANPSRLVPSCEVPGRGVAFPPRRIVEVAQSFGDNSVVQSICQEDFTPVVDAILQRVAARVSGACGAP